MSMVSLSLSRALAIGTVLLLATAGTAVAQAPAPAPLAYPVPQLTLAEARAIIEGAIAYARESNMRMAVAVVDHAGNIVSSDRMDGAALQNIRFALGAPPPEKISGASRRGSLTFCNKFAVCHSRKDLKTLTISTPSLRLDGKQAGKRSQRLFAFSPTEAGH